MLTTIKGFKITIIMLKSSKRTKNGLKSISPFFTKLFVILLLRFLNDTGHKVAPDYYWSEQGACANARKWPLNYYFSLPIIFSIPKKELSLDSKILYGLLSHKNIVRLGQGQTRAQPKAITKFTLNHHPPNHPPPQKLLRHLQERYKVKFRYTT